MLGWLIWSALVISHNSQACFYILGQMNLTSAQVCSLQSIKFMQNKFNLAQPIAAANLRICKLHIASKYIKCYL